MASSDRIRETRTPDVVVAAGGVSIDADVFTDPHGLGMRTSALQKAGAEASWLHYDQATHRLVGYVPGSAVGATQAKEFAAVTAHATESGGTTTIALDGADKVVLDGIHNAWLSQYDFHFE